MSEYKIVFGPEFDFGRVVWLIGNKGLLNAGTLLEDGEGNSFPILSIGMVGGPVEPDSTAAVVPKTANTKINKVYVRS